MEWANNSHTVQVVPLQTINTGCLDGSPARVVGVGAALGPFERSEPTNAVRFTRKITFVVAFLCPHLCSIFCLFSIFFFFDEFFLFGRGRFFISSLLYGRLLLLHQRKQSDRKRGKELNLVRNTTDDQHYDQPNNSNHPALSPQQKKKFHTSTRRTFDWRASKAGGTRWQTWKSTDRQDGRRR